MSAKNRNIFIIGLGLITAAAFFLAPIDDKPSDGFFRFLGRFHVMALHFPLTLLLVAVVGEFLSRRDRFASLAPAVPLLWWSGALSAVVTALLGLTLAASEGYALEKVIDHRNGGVAVALLSLLGTDLHYRLKSGSKTNLKHAMTGLGSILVLLTFYTGHAGGNLVRGESYLGTWAPAWIQAWVPGFKGPETADFEITDQHFLEKVQPVLTATCYECHDANKQKGNVRLDILNPDMIEGHDAPKWHAALDMLNSSEMPPKEGRPLASEERRTLITWITENLAKAAEAKKGDTEAVIRRLTREQYTNAMQDVLALPVDFGKLLPGDPKSGDGFTNNGHVLQATSLHLDYFRDIARNGVRKAIGPAERPDPRRYRVSYGTGIGKGQGSRKKLEAYQEVGVDPNDYRVDLIDAAGNVVAPATDEDHARLADVRKKVGTGMRGSASARFWMAKDGMMLYGALPHKEVTPKSWQGPSPNLKMQLQRAFPGEGAFRMRVKASKGYFPAAPRPTFVSIPGLKPAISIDQAQGAVSYPDDSVILPASQIEPTRNAVRDGDYIVPVNFAEKAQAEGYLEIRKAGFYQIDLIRMASRGDQRPNLRLSLDGRSIGRGFSNDDMDTGDQRRPQTIGVAWMEPGRHRAGFNGEFMASFSELVASPYTGNRPEIAIHSAPSADRQKALLSQTPILTGYAGTFTDDGMNYQTFETSHEVNAPFGQPQIYDFVGRLENFPIPEAESGDTEPLSGIMVMGVWNDLKVKSAGEHGTPILVQSIEFEAPFYPEWPSNANRQIFADLPGEEGSTEQTGALLERFMTRAFRRPAVKDEVDRYVAFHESIKGEFDSYADSIAEVLVAVLTSPNFLYLAEPEEIDLPNASEYQLATRLAFFLWDSPPDDELLNLAAGGTLSGRLDEQIDRLLKDDRAARFVRQFASQWLRLDRAETISIDADRYPAFSRFVKADMQQETIAYVQHVLKGDLPVTDLVASDYVMVNQNLAEYYGIDGVIGPEFRPVKIDKAMGRGGLLTQGAFLSGHSSGTEAHPFKRAVWLRDRILGNPPPAPPPNVPELDPDTPGFERLTLKQQLELHRNKESCRDCHAGIDPWGIVFEGYDAGGIRQATRKGRPIDDFSIMPDGAIISGVQELQTYILDKRKDQFTRALIKRLYGYALGRDISYTDNPTLEAILEKTRESGYSAQAMVGAIVHSADFIGDTATKGTQHAQQVAN